MQLASRHAAWIPKQARPLLGWQTTRHTRLRGLTTLAIETSCDDTSVAVLSLDGQQCQVKYHRTITAQSQQYGGIHPLVAQECHQANIATLVSEARQSLIEDGHFQKPTFISVTRGPGMRSSLAAGLMTAKGIATAWDIPLLGIHHMQAHALTPRLCSLLPDGGIATRSAATSMGGIQAISPRFPYLTVLASGGHTMLLRSESLIDHKILAETHDIAIGDCLDKAARAILPPDTFEPPYGRALEQFAFPRGASDYAYTAPESRQHEMTSQNTTWKWALKPPLASSGSGEKSPRRMMFSFAGLTSSVLRFAEYKVDENGQHAKETRGASDFPVEERQEMARQVLRVSFEHLISRILLYLSEMKDTDINTIVVSGGVAANHYLRHVLRAMLDVRGLHHIKTVFPPPAMCTDNALMIAWAGMEMFLSGYRSNLDILPIKKWSMDTNVDGGILGAQGWLKYESDTD